MKTLLVTSSPNPNSASSDLARRALSEAGIAPFASIDTVLAPPPAYGADLMAGVFAGSTSEASKAAVAASDAYIDQLIQAELLVVAVPMHNFGVPSGFKAWMDQVARPGKTFKYGAAGPEGLLKGKKALVVASSGGDYTQGGPALAYEHAASHVKAFLGFLGMQVEVVWIPGQAGAAAASGRSKAVEDASKALASLAVAA